MRGHTYLLFFFLAAPVTSTDAAVGNSTRSRFLQKDLMISEKASCPKGYIDHTNGFAYYWGCAVEKDCPTANFKAWSDTFCECACQLPSACVKITSTDICVTPWELAAGLGVEDATTTERERWPSNYNPWKVRSSTVAPTVSPADTEEAAPDKHSSLPLILALVLIIGGGCFLVVIFWLRCIGCICEASSEQEMLGSETKLSRVQPMPDQPCHHGHTEAFPEGMSLPVLLGAVRMDRRCMKDSSGKSCVSSQNLPGMCVEEQGEADTQPFATHSPSVSSSGQTAASRATAFNLQAARDSAQDSAHTDLANSQSLRQTGRSRSPASVDMRHVSPPGSSRSHRSSRSVRSNLRSVSPIAGDTFADVQHLSPPGSSRSYGPVSSRSYNSNLWSLSTVATQSPSWSARTSCADQSGPSLQLSSRSTGQHLQPTLQRESLDGKLRAHSQTPPSKVSLHSAGLDSLHASKRRPRSTPVRTKPGGTSLLQVPSSAAHLRPDVQRNAGGSKFQHDLK